MDPGRYIHILGPVLLEQSRNIRSWSREYFILEECSTTLPKDLLLDWTQGDIFIYWDPYYWSHWS